MTATTRRPSVRVFIASSLDGFIAGPGGDLSWLPGPPEGSGEDFGAIATLCPVVLGAGHSLFAGVKRPHALRLRSTRELPGELVQLTYTTAG